MRRARSPARRTAALGGAPCVWRYGFGRHSTSGSRQRMVRTALVIAGFAGISAACAGDRASDHVAAVHPSGFSAAEPFVTLVDFHGGPGQCEVTVGEQRCYACTTAQLERHARALAVDLPGVDLEALTRFAERQSDSDNAPWTVTIAYEIRPADQPDLEFMDDVGEPICVAETL